MSDYESALKAAGATVHVFKEFGSYQGEWYALVTYNGEKGWVQGSYGSCSGCDAFAAEFGFSDNPFCNKHIFNAKTECLGCQEAKAKYDAKLADFGRGYLGGIATSELILKGLEKQAKWDSESREASTWIKGIES